MPPELTDTGQIVPRDSSEIERLRSDLLSFFAVELCLLALTKYHSVGNTSCFTPSGGGPDPNDCKIISDALRYESQNTGKIVSPSLYR